MGHLVIAAYRPRPGRAKELRAVVADHLPVLRRQGLVTDRPALVLCASDGTLLELFEWKSEAAVEAAHSNPAVRELWGRFEEVSEIVRLADLPEAGRRFPHFEPLTP